MKNIVFLVTILVLLAGCAPAEKGPVKIGFVGPFSGGPAQFGEMMQHGLDAALQELPESERAKFVIIKEDDKGKAVDAVTAVKKLIEVDDVDFVIGPMMNEAVIATENLFEENKVIALTIGLPSNKIANMGAYHFSFSPEIEYLMETMAGKVFSLGFKRVAVIHMNAAFEKENDIHFVNHFKALGGEVVIDEAFDKGTADYRTGLAKIKQADPDALMIMAHTGELNNILQQVNELGMGNLPKFGIHAAETPMLLKVGPIAEGFIYPYPADKQQSPASQRYAQRYVELFKTSPDPYSSNVYDSFKILVDALDKCNNDKECVRNRIAGLQNYEGANGVLTLDDRGVGTYKEIMLKTVRNGAFEKLQ